MKTQIIDLHFIMILLILNLIKIKLIVKINKLIKVEWGSQLPMNPFLNGLSFFLILLLCLNFHSFLPLVGSKASALTNDGSS